MFMEIEDYREDLEIRHLRTKNHFVLALLTLMMILTLIYMLVSGFLLYHTLALLIGFLIVIMFNIAQLAYGKDIYQFYQLNKYITTMGVYALSIAIIFVFQSPSAITVLFIAYAISAFYQDLKVMFINNFLLLFSALMLMVNFSEYLNFQSSNTETEFGIAFFLVAFISILTISSFIIIKQKRFYYNQIALSRETEFRSIDLLIDLEEQNHQNRIDIDSYYKKAQDFFQEFSEILKMDNPFKERMGLLYMLEKNEPVNRILDRYPHVTKEDLERMEDLLIGGKHKLRKVAMKLGHTFTSEVGKAELFSEQQFKSFNHPNDALDVKILLFAVFYAALKRGIAGLPLADKAAMRRILTSTDYYYYVDPKVIDIYEKNSEVFDEICEDILGRKAER
jgi:hypothetical protein